MKGMGRHMVLGYPNTLRLEDGLAKSVSHESHLQKVVFVCFLSINTEFDANV